MYKNELNDKYLYMYSFAWRFHLSMYHLSENSCDEDERRKKSDSIGFFKNILYFRQWNKLKNISPPLHNFRKSPSSFRVLKSEEDGKIIFADIPSTLSSAIIIPKSCTILHYIWLFLTTSTYW